MNLIENWGIVKKPKCFQNKIRIGIPQFTYENHRFRKWTPTLGCGILLLQTRNQASAPNPFWCNSIEYDPQDWYTQQPLAKPSEQPIGWNIEECKTESDVQSKEKSAHYESVDHLFRSLYLRPG